MSARDIIVLGCSSQQPTRFRNHGAYLVRWNSEGLLFDPGEGTQRQFIFADVAPPTVTRIFISHFHGDHCLGFGSMLMRLNLDKVSHPIHCYYPASGKKYFDRLRYCCIYKEHITVIEHPVTRAGLVEDDGKFRIGAEFLDHGVENIGWRIQEADTVKFHKEKLRALKLDGPIIRTLEKEGRIEWDGRWILVEEVSHVRTGDVFAYVVDTRPCKEAVRLAQDAKVLICESTYLDQERAMAEEYKHMTALQAAQLALEANVETLILTHFSARYRDPEVLGAEARKIFPNTFVAEDLKKYPFPK
ncbi:MAG: ribonuclease Z [Chlamydiae bacterium RIFCSPHIGHO2_12_FULL_44_59]|nr:MAG: ribonuclease Z [Chlamydiae bacterium RIFCSPHIGHO2_01_FULL_44_39]OGN59786.1 MAG: ribonuclease Z [Chlamydiae bacterium RIFCSPHIGHO2_12_FULL_44_59]OGN65884.1 MAG: ribonuclease Z [Chlamydiae bacterium RIFCSPLOWO2_01_FULL_44_52]OGN68294.1 MAG: ribonuclease Z [Chlamydiae bacterium RIFCSPLOWO2_02_FULL_45_22]OGN69604.1 MAG: ribonuclease Z [Chlamydiae bacterium RIFCSPLOWO2_12_FULL_45_20]